jgi:hypothetical protein
MKKSMKKRSLLSAVAMLVVSAIVLTSATYAWFSMSNSARVENLDVRVAAQSGLELSLNNVDWFSTITEEHFETVKELDLSALNFAPVDALRLGDDTLSFRKGSLADDVITMGTATANADYLEFDLNLRVGKPGTVKFTQGTGSESSISGLNTATIAYASITDTTGTKIYAADSNGAYNAINSDVTSTQAVNGIAQTAAHVTPTTIQSGLIDSHELVFTDAGTQSITVRVWIEGQDAQCQGSYSGGTVGINLLLNFIPDEEPSTT